MKDTKPHKGEGGRRKKKTSQGERGTRNKTKPHKGGGPRTLVWFIFHRCGHACKLEERFSGRDI